MSVGNGKRGRPIGSKSDAPRAEAVLSRCGVCGSTDRTKYENTKEREHPYPGTDDNGNPYTHTVWRHTACTNCGQSRVDMTRENRAPASIEEMETDNA